MTQHTLSSDRLGAKGESHFQGICEDAALTCNKSTRDLTGWDFIIEFPFTETEDTHSLDSRSAPLSAHIQVKTLLVKNNVFRMRLSSAERLAKEIKPTFVYVAKVDGITFTEAFLIHILDLPLAKILERLRKEHAAENTLVINRKYIYFDASTCGKRIEPTGAALRTALAEACGKNIEDYTRLKKEQRDRLGFDPLPYKGSLRFRQLRDIHELVEVFLGLKRKIEVTHFQISEVRFGIPICLPLSATDIRFVSIDPNPIDSCIITIRQDGLTLPALFSAEIFAPPIPDLPGYARRLLVKSQLFAFVLSPSGDCSFKLSEDIASQRHPVELWANMARLLVAFSLGNVKIEIKNQNRPDRFDFMIENKMNVFDGKRCKAWLALCDHTEFLGKSAGVPSDVKLSVKDIEQGASAIFRACAFLNGEARGFSFTSERPTGLHVSSPMRALFAGCVELGDLHLAYYLLADVVPETSGDRIVWRSVSIDRAHVRTLRGKVEFIPFAKEVGAETGADMVITIPHAKNDVLALAERQNGSDDTSLG